MQNNQSVHQSKLGFHPCDYATYRKLRKIKGAMNAAWEAYWRKVAAKNRWQAKQPQNRVIRRKIRDASGRVVGREIVGPAPEPIAVKPVIGDPSINWIEEYNKARFPKGTSHQVVPLGVTNEQIEAALTQIGG